MGGDPAIAPLGPDAAAATPPPPPSSDDAGPGMPPPPLASTLGSLLTVDAKGNPNGFVRRALWEASYVPLRRLLFPQLPGPPP